MMPHALAHSLEILTTMLAVDGMGYFLAALVAARVYLAVRRAPLAAFAPGVSILKSLKGLDPGMIDAFRSHCRQSYAGEYELLFGVSSLGDPAAAAVEQLLAEFPERAIRLIECPERLGTNGKVSTLAQLAAHARYDFLLINDSDITVSPALSGTGDGLLRSGDPPEQAIAARTRRQSELRQIGLVTALYRGRAHGTLPSRLEALGIATDFQAAVLLSKWIEGGLHYGLGSTLAVRPRGARQDRRPCCRWSTTWPTTTSWARAWPQAGYRVALSAEVVETNIPAYGWRGFIDHQLRWARTVRDVRPWGYAGLIFTHGLGWALAQCAGQRTEPVEPVAAGVELLPAARAGHDGGRRGAGRPPGAAESLAAAAARPGRHGRLGGRLCRQHHRLARRALPAQGRKAAKRLVEAFLRIGRFLNLP